LKFKVTSRIEDISIAAWEKFVQEHPHGSVLQSHFLYKVFQQTQKMKPVFICCLDSNEEIQGIVVAVIIMESGGLKGKFSSRAVIYGGPLMNENHKRKTQIADLLLDNLIRKVKPKSIFIQIRASYDMSDYDEVLRKYDFRWHPRLNLLIDTSDKSAAWSGVSASRKRQIRKSISNGAKIIEPVDESQVRTFYDILFGLYRNKVKKPLPDWSFFSSFYKAILGAGGQKINARYFLVEFENRIIGGILCPFMNDGTLFEWYVCGLDQEYKQRGAYPSVMATWAAIDFASKNNFQQFDFMGVGIPGKEYGVRDFKMKFGGHQVNYGRYTRINNRWVYLIAELGYNLLSLIKKI
jgi:lipid II:glycine glycyltransferase (peptidoglycan interpeptide bridge formation enzyme)